MLLTDRRKDQHKVLDPAELMRVAEQETGLSDFGGEEFIEPYRKLLECTARDCDFHAKGLADFKSNIVRGLVNRLRTQHDFLRHPEIFDEDVSDPIVIIGLPRSGTTKLQRILAAPVDVQKTYLWRLLYPGRFPNAAPGQPDPRIAASGIAHLDSDENPDFQTMHLMTKEEPEEDWILLEPTFNDWQWVMSYAASPAFHNWVTRRPGLDNYRYGYKLLQYLQWQDGGKRSRPWILKSTGHLSHMEALLECFPKATLIHTHRDPCNSIASMAKLQCFLWEMKLNDVDPKNVGPQVLLWWKREMDSYLETRDRLRLDERIFDVQYSQVRVDPMPVMREVYRRAGRAFSPEAENSMMQWNTENKEPQFGSNQYTPEEYGLSKKRIDEAFAEYIDRFITR